MAGIYLFHHTDIPTITCLTFGFLIAVAILIFPFRNKSILSRVQWVSIKSWFILAPIIIIMIGFYQLLAVITLTCVALLATKEFFKITGIYHQVSYLWLTYIFILLFAGVAVFKGKLLYNLLPMIYLGLLPLIAVIKNRSPQNMLQLTCLSLLACLLIGWGFLHTLWIVLLSDGAFYLIYLILLVELFNHIHLTISHLCKKKWVKITHRRTLEGWFIAGSIVFVISYFVSTFLPIGPFWWAISLIVVFMGGWGSIVLALISKDVGVKEDSLFIIGRDGTFFLNRVTHLAFVASVAIQLGGASSLSH